MAAERRRVENADDERGETGRGGGAAAAREWQLSTRQTLKNVLAWGVSPYTINGCTGLDILMKMRLPQLFLKLEQNGEGS